MIAFVDKAVLKAFETVPDLYLILSPDLVVLAASDAYLAATLTQRANLVGKHVVDAFFVNQANQGIADLEASLQQVITARKPHRVTLQDYQVPQSQDGVGAEYTYTHWRSLNTPILDEQGQILYIIHKLEDVTESDTQQRLVESKRLLQEAEVVAHMGSYEGELATMRFRFSDNMYRLLGYEPRSIVPTLNWIDSISHPEDAVMVRQIIEQAAQEKQPYQYLRRIYWPDGQMRYIASKGKVVCDASGKAVKILGIIQDITERKRAEEQIQEQANFIQQVTDAVPGTITIYDLAEKRIVYSNRRQFDQLGYSEQELNEMDNLRWIDKILHPDDRQAMRQHIEAMSVAPDDNVRSLDYRIQAKARGWEWRRTRAKVFKRDMAGRPLQYISLAQNITWEKQAEEQVRRTAENLQAVLNSSPASIGLLQAVRNDTDQIEDFQLVVANERFARFVGRPIDQVPYLRVSDLVDQLWGAQTVSRLLNVVETGELFYVEQPSPVRGWLALSVTKQDDGVVVTGLDITDFKQVQKQQEQLLDQIKQSGRTVEELDSLRQELRKRGELLRTSTHDLRGSLGIIGAAASLLSYVTSDEEREQMLEILQRNVTEMSQMITDLLDYARLEAGQEQIQVTPFDAGDLLRKLGESVEPVVKNKGLALHLEGPEHLYLESDAINVLRIAQNLVLNALKYTPSGSITLCWQEISTEEWCFSVTDTGPGMPPELAQQLSRDSEKTGLDRGMPKRANSNGGDTDVPLLGPTSGEGIGLRIAKQLCVLLQGRMAVESGPGGSVFKVTLPRRY